MVTPRTRALETELRKLRGARMGALGYDMWSQHGAEFATVEERTQIEAEFAACSRTQEEATAALTALIAASRTEAPDELRAWVGAHDAYLAAFIAEAKDPDGMGVFCATGDRAKWAEVLAGTRDIVDESLAYITDHPARYRDLFGIELAPPA